MKKLIVNADDFGLTVAVTKGIVDGHRMGIITSTSIMPGAEAFLEAVQETIANPSLDIGVHLTLDEEYPVLKRGIETLIDSEGKLHNRSTLIKHLLSGKVKLAHVEQEWDAQIEKCIAHGLSLSHLNCHGHIHAFPSLFPIALELAKHYKIPVIRRPVEGLFLNTTIDISFTKWMKKILISGCASYSFSRQRFTQPAVTEHFIGLLCSGNLIKSSFDRILNKIQPDGVTELMTHPGYCDSNTQTKYRAWNYKWAQELDTLLIDSQKRHDLEARQIVLTNFRKEYGG